MDRATRRALDAEERLTRVRNGLSHETLSLPAFTALNAALTSFDNKLSERHRVTLVQMLSAYTEMAQGYLRGRWAVGLGTGLGKTQSIIAWLTQLHRSGADQRVSAAVFAGKVEELCKIKRALVSRGVPEPKVALLHTYTHDAGKAAQGVEGFASEPATFEDRQIVLATHNKVRGGKSEELYLRHHGDPRSINFWDESLLLSDSRVLALSEIASWQGWLRGQTRGLPEYDEVVEYLRECDALICSELDQQRKEDRRPKAIYLPSLSEEQARTFSEQLRRWEQCRPELRALRDLLAMKGRALRAASQGGGGVVWYDLAVPEELDNVIVLDASYAIRELVKQDKTVKSLSEHDASFRPEGLKAYHTLQISQMLVSGSRDAMTKAFRRRQNRGIVRAIGDVVEQIPTTEGVILFTFKPRAKQPDFASELRGELAERGVDLEATVRDHDGQSVPRFVWLTFGQETALSEHAYCRNVIFAGVLHRDRLELMGAIAGQRNDLFCDLREDDVRRVVDGEIDHVVYQGLSRGACRRTHDGVAAPMRAWIIHKDPRISVRLNEVLPGARWCRWAALGAEQTKTGTILADVLAHLGDVPAGQTKVSTRNLKAHLGYTKVPPRTWTDAIQALPEESGWRLLGRSLVRSAL